MVERDTVFKGKVKQKGIFNFKEFYEFLYDYLTDEGKPWDRKGFAKIAKVVGNDKQVSGVVLVQMLEDRRIKFEAFPGKTAAQYLDLRKKQRFMRDKKLLAEKE